MSILKSILRILTATPKRNGENFQLRRDIKNSKKVDVSMQSLMKDIHHSKSLYDSLKTKIHPDRFIGSDKHEFAVSLFQELTSNRRNHSKLLEIQQIANEQLLNN